MGILEREIYGRKDRGYYAWTISYPPALVKLFALYLFNSCFGFRTKLNHYFSKKVIFFLDSLFKYIYNEVGIVTSSKTFLSYNFTCIFVVI